MALLNPAFVIGQGANTAKMFRQVVYNTYGGAGGVLGTTHLQITAGSAPLTSVNAAAGSAVVVGAHGPVGQGAYMVTNDAAFDAVTSIPAASAGNTRKDLIVARVYDADYSPDSTNVWAIERVAGTQSTSTPSEPSLPATSSCLTLAMIDVNSSGISAITDRRTFASPGAVQSSTWLGPWNLPWGVIGQTVMPSGTQSGITTATDLNWGSTAMSVVLSSKQMVANRRYRVVASVGDIYSSVSGDTAQIQIIGPSFSGVTQYGRSVVLLGGANISSTYRAEIVFTANSSGPTGTGTWKAQGLRANGTGTISFGATSLQSQAYIYIEDIGPATATPLG